MFHGMEVRSIGRLSRPRSGDHRRPWLSDKFGGSKPEVHLVHPFYIKSIGETKKIEGYVGKVHMVHHSRRHFPLSRQAYANLRTPLVLGMSAG